MTGSDETGNKGQLGVCERHGCPPRVCSVSGSPQTTWRAV